MGKKSSFALAAAGAHAAREHTESPVVRELSAQAGVLQCSRCKAVHHDKRWYAPEATAKVPISGELKQSLCPGCYCVENRICNGEVILKGPIADKVRSAAHGLIANVESECWKDNPKSRILSFNDLGDSIEVTTTTEWLAMRIGKQIRKSLKGKLDIKRFPEESFARVVWTAG